MPMGPISQGMSQSIQFGQKQQELTMRQSEIEANELQRRFSKKMSILNGMVAVKAPKQVMRGYLKEIAIDALGQFDFLEGLTDEELDVTLPQVLSGWDQVKKGKMDIVTYAELVSRLDQSQTAKLKYLQESSQALDEQYLKTEAQNTLSPLNLGDVRERKDPTELANVAQKARTAGRPELANKILGWMDDEKDTGAGKIDSLDLDKRYQSWLKMAQSAAIGQMTFNPGSEQMKWLQTIQENPDDIEILSTHLQQSMTPEQRIEYRDHVNNYMRMNVPVELLPEVESRVTRSIPTFDQKYVKKDVKITIPGTLRNAKGILKYLMDTYPNIFPTEQEAANWMSNNLRQK